MDVSSRVYSQLDEIVGAAYLTHFTTGWNKFAYVDFVAHNYAMATLAEQLASVQAAIAEIESDGESYHLDTQGKTRPKLSTLYERESRLLRKIQHEEGLGRTVAVL